MAVVLAIVAGSAAAREDAGQGDAGRIVVVDPPSVFGGEQAIVTVDGRTRDPKVGEEQVGVKVEAGSYAVYGAASGKAVATLTVDSGAVLYLVDRGDAQAQRKLADILFDGGNKAAALELYRAALALDSSLTSILNRYAKLEAALGKSATAMAALRKVIAAGGADAGTYRALGDLHLARKRYEEAARMYETALREGGETASVLAGLGAIKMKTGDLEGAADAFERATRLEPDTARHYRALGDALAKGGDTTRAVVNYRLFLDKGGRSSAVARRVGAYDFRLRRFEDAARYLALVKGKLAGGEDHLRQLGESYYRIGRYEKAFPPLRTAGHRFRRSPRWPTIIELLIKTYIAMEEYKKATYWVNKYAKAGKRGSPEVAYYQAFLKEQDSPAGARRLYEKNIDDFPRDHRNYLRLGLMEAKSKNTAARGISLLKKAVSLADTIPEAWLEIARAYRQLGKHDDELAALKVFVASEPQHPEANARIGQLMLTKGDTDKALEKLEQAREEASDDPAVLRSLAQGYARTGRYDEAIETLVAAKKKAPRDVSIRRPLVDLYRRTGRTAEALEELEELLKLSRDNATLLVYARLCRREKKYAKAVDAIENIRATDPANVDALMLLGEVLRATERFEEAVEVYKEIAVIEPDNYRALYERAETHLGQNKLNWAKKFFERTLRAKSDFVPAYVGLAKVARLRGDRSGYRANAARARRLDPDHPKLEELADAD
jgi:tetratricopeptide (TPR) repeat protein